MLVPIFNIINSFSLDYMHSVLLGVVKMFLHGLTVKILNTRGTLDQKRKTLIAVY